MLSGIGRRGRQAWGPLVATVLIGLVVAPACASAAVITFEDLDAPGRGGVGLTVNVQYSAQGVTFNDPQAFDYEAGSFAVPGFAHSGNVAVEACVAAEFCTSPIRATFTAGQRSVKVHAGMDGQLVEPQTVRMTAFDASGVVVGTDEATMAASASPTPVDTLLQIDVADPTIRRIEVSITSGGSLAIDDLEFTTEGPPPPCPASGPPTVTLTDPPAGGGLTVQNNEFLLRGSVNPNGAPITSATITATASAQRTGNLYPSLIQPTGGTFGPTRFNGLLNPGDNLVEAAATNCAGTGTSIPRRVRFTPIDAGARFRQFGQIEVTQGIQDASNSVPVLAATAASSKRTFARVHLGLTGASAPISSVTGTLTAVRPDGSRPPGPLRVTSLGAITVSPAATQASARSKLANGLLFELPRDWLGAGRLHLQLEHLFVEGTQSARPCDGCENPGVGGPATVNFHTVPPLRIFLVGVPYTTIAGATNAPRQLDFDLLASWLRRVYPSAEVQITQTAMAALPDPPTDCHDVNADLRDFAAAMTPAQDERTRFYGLVSVAGGNFMRGCAVIGGRFASGPTGPGTFGWDNDGSFGDWYGGHELGHTYTRLHPGMCDESDDDGGYPYPGGVIGNQIFDKQGFDAGDGALSVAMALNDWRDGWSDVMTYCDRQWISDYTYRGILRNVCETDVPNCPDHVLFTGRSAPRAAARPATHAAARTSLRLSIAGTIARTTGRLTLAPMWLRRGIGLSRRPARSDYAIVLRDRRGRTRARYPFTPKAEEFGPPLPGSPAQPRTTSSLVVDEVVALRAGSARIIITKGGRVLGSRRVSAHAPKVRIRPLTRPTASFVTVRWRASDADGGRRTYSVLYAHDGKRFSTVASGLRRSSLRVDLRRLPGGSRARFRVLANDGVRSGSGTSRTLSVAVKAPRVLIASPARGAEVGDGEPISLRATASDPQDARLPASALRWTSSLQGELGRGEAITATLAPGTHTITLTATNKAGRASSATVMVTVREPLAPLVVSTPP